MDASSGFSALDVCAGREGVWDFLACVLIISINQASNQLGRGLLGVYIGLARAVLYSVRCGAVRIGIVGARVSIGGTAGVHGWLCRGFVGEG